MNQYKVFLDGGSKGNTKDSGLAYGSYFFMNMGTKEHKIIRLEYPKLNTSNEAEWETLIKVLEMLEKSPKARVRLFMDSKLVVNQFNGDWRCKDSRMLDYKMRAHELLHKLENSEIDLSLEWIPRDDIEMFLGH